MNLGLPDGFSLLADDVGVGPGAVRAARSEWGWPVASSAAAHAAAVVLLSLVFGGEGASVVPPQTGSAAIEISASFRESSADTAYSEAPAQIAPMATDLPPAPADVPFDLAPADEPLARAAAAEGIPVEPQPRALPPGPVGELPPAAALTVRAHDPAPSPASTERGGVPRRAAGGSPATTVPATALAGAAALPAAASNPSQASSGADSTEPPQVVFNVAPVYPAEARRRGWTGRVWIHARIDAAGRVLKAWVERSSGHDPLDQAALNAVRLWRFSPARDPNGPLRVVPAPIDFILR